MISCRSSSRLARNRLNRQAGVNPRYLGHPAQLLFRSFIAKQSPESGLKATYVTSNRENSKIICDMENLHAELIAPTGKMRRQSRDKLPTTMSSAMLNWRISVHILPAFPKAFKRQTSFSHAILRECETYPVRGPLRVRNCHERRPMLWNQPCQSTWQQLSKRPSEGRYHLVPL